MSDKPANTIDVEQETYVSKATFLYWAMPVLVALLTIAAFSRCLRNEFVWDDQGAIVRNEHIDTISPESLKWMFTTFYTGPYQPLSWLSLAIDVRLWGRESAFGFHLTSMLLHTLTAVAFYFLAYRLLRIVTEGPTSQESSRQDKPDGVPRPSLVWAAGVAALFFAIHPLRVESVAWATERRDVLSGLFFVLTLLCYVRFATMEEGELGRKVWYVVSVVLAGMALLSKGTTVTLPILLLLLDVYPLRRFYRRSGVWWHPMTERTLAEKVPVFVMAFGIGVLAILGQAEAGAMMDLADHGIFARVLVALASFGFHIRSLVLPILLSPLYEMPADLLNVIGKLVVCILIGGGITGILIWKRKRYPGLLWAWVAYMVMLLPMSGLVQVGVHLAADRYTYLPSMSIALAVAAGFYVWWRRSSDDTLQREAFIKKPLIAVAVVSTLYVFLTSWQCSFWENDIRLWERAIESDSEAGVAYYNLGDAWARSNLLNRKLRHENAIAAYRNAVSKRPDMILAWQNLGNALLLKGDAEQAVKVFQQGLSHAEASRDVSADMHANMALALMRSEQFDRAIESAKQAVAVNPNHAAAYNIMGLAYQQKGQVDQALEAFYQSIDADEKHVHAYENISRLLMMLHRWGEVVDVLRQAHEVLPEERQISNTLAWVLATCPRDEVRDGLSAVSIARQLCAETDNKNISFLDTYAAALAENGEFEKAVAVLDRAIEIAELNDPTLAARLKGRRHRYETRQPTRMN